MAFGEEVAHRPIERPRQAHCDALRGHERKGSIDGADVLGIALEHARPCLVHAHIGDAIQGRVEKVDNSAHGAQHVRIVSHSTHGRKRAGGAEIEHRPPSGRVYCAHASWSTSTSSAPCFARMPRGPPTRWATSTRDASATASGSRAMARWPSSTVSSTPPSFSPRARPASSLTFRDSTHACCRFQSSSLAASKSATRSTGCARWTAWPWHLARSCALRPVVVVEPLGPAHETELRELFADGRDTGDEPDFFIASQLEDETFFGVRDAGRLVAAGGTHLYSAGRERRHDRQHLHVVANIAAAAMRLR